MATQQCTVCGVEKQAIQFRWNSRTGYRTECLECEKTWLRCSACKAVKSHEEFPPCKKMSTGRHSLCNACHLARMQAKYHGSEEHRKKQKVYSRGETARQKRREYNSRPDIKAKARARDEERNRRSLANPQERVKNAARHRATAALRKGKLVKPARCQADGKYGNECVGSPVEMHHHKGYARENALNVEWLCPPCHVVANMQCRDAGISTVKEGS